VNELGKKKKKADSFNIYLPPIAADPYPKVPEQDHKPTMTVYCRVVFADTGTVKDLTPTHMNPNDQYELNYTRNMNGREFEPREGVKYIGYLDDDKKA
jgi:hypothetical protein